jgi:hypothetical protein
VADAKRRRGGVAPRKEKRQSQTPARMCQRVRSGLTQAVKVIEGTNVTIHGTFRGKTSGQLPFLGLNRRRLAR